MTEITTLQLPGSTGFPGMGRGYIFFVGTATTILRIGGFTLLTDPNFLHAGEHAHLGYGLKSKRLTNPAVEIDDLPEIDLCILSHAHGDHWDQVAAERLDKSLPVATTPDATRLLGKQGFRQLYGLDTWDQLVVEKGSARLRITAMPGRHGPGPVQALLPSVMGSMLEWSTGGGEPTFRLYISGDTLMVKELAEIPKRYPEIDLALVHLGGTRLFGLMLTMDARSGVRLLRLIHPRAAVPIHYNDYPVFKSRLEDFLREAREAGLETELHPLAHGESYEFQMQPQPTSSVPETGVRDNR